VKNEKKKLKTLISKKKKQLEVNSNYVIFQQEQAVTFALTKGENPSGATFY